MGIRRELNTTTQQNLETAIATVLGLEKSIMIYESEIDTLDTQIVIVANHLAALEQQREELFTSSLQLLNS